MLWGARVVVPPPGREQELHKTHPGIARMKSLARSCVVAKDGCRPGGQGASLC